MRIAESHRTAKVLLVAGAAALALGHACEDLSEAPEDLGSAVEPECKVDDDCILMPSEMTCCGKCDPAPPFEAVPRSAVDSRLIELETECASRTRWCESPVCDITPPGCAADAACIAGRCQAIAAGCDVRIADRVAGTAATERVCESIDGNSERLVVRNAGISR